MLVPSLRSQGIIKLLNRKRQVPDNWHEDFIVHLASLLRPRVYVELGLYKCQLFNRIIPYAETLIGLDVSEEAGLKMVKSSKTQFIHKTSSQFADDLKKNPVSIDLLFIDADHSKEWVQKDFEAYFPFVSDQGMILLHDGYPKNKKYTESGYCGDGYIAIEELTKAAGKHGYEMMTIPVHPGVTLCRKRSEHLQWIN